MQVTKNQHYVPRFYMKNFSEIVFPNSKKEKSFISFYQFDGDIKRESVPTTSICSEDFFYGEDGVTENELSKKESVWSYALNKVAQDKPLLCEDIESIREFTMYQMIRTKAILSHTQNMAEVFMTDYLDKCTEIMPKETVRQMVKEKVKEKISPNIDLAIELLPEIGDLEIAIVNNLTEVEFITSDVPVVITNPVTFNHIGIATVGAVLFFPVTPYRLIVMYDEKVYGNVSSEIKETNMIDKINKYQYLNADERILSKTITSLDCYIGDIELNEKRNNHLEAVLAQTMKEKDGTLLASKSRGIFYYYDVLGLKLPVQLKKIPREYRFPYSRRYDYEERLSLLCKIYRDANPEEDGDIKDSWATVQKHSKELLKYLDYYWQTPKEDMDISPLLMKTLKTVPYTVHRPKGSV